MHTFSKYSYHSIVKYSIKNLTGQLQEETSIMVYRNIESALHGSWNVIQTHTHQNTHPYFIHIRRAVTSPLDRTTSCPGPPPRTLTLIGAVGVRLVAVVSAVVVSVTGPVVRDAAAAVALELSAGTGVAAARLVTVVPAVVV